MNVAAKSIAMAGVMLGACGCATKAPVAASAQSAVAHQSPQKPAGIDPEHPRPRPQIVGQQQVRPAILAENPKGMANIGMSGIDARWSNYGVYLQRMIDTIQIEWERVLIESKTYPPSGTNVQVKFILNSEGRIARIVEVQNHSTDQGSHACLSGITNRAPYGPWTNDMKAVLGDQQEMTFTFYYQ